MITENNEDKITEAKQYKRNPNFIPSSNSLRTRSETLKRLSVSLDLEASNTLPPSTPRATADTNNGTSSQIDYVEFVEKQKLTDLKKDMQEKHKNIMLDFQSKFLALEEKLKEKQNNQQEQRLEAELNSYIQKVEEAKQLEQQLYQQVHITIIIIIIHSNFFLKIQQQRKLFEAFEIETQRHNKAMSDHVTELESKLMQQRQEREKERQEREKELGEQKEKHFAELENERAKVCNLESEIAELQSKIAKLQAQVEQSETSLSHVQVKTLQDKIVQLQEKQQEQQQFIEQQNAKIEELTKTMYEQALKFKLPGKVSPNISPREVASPRELTQNSLTMNFAKKIFSPRDDETGTVERANDTCDTPEFLELRNKLKKVQSFREEKKSDKNNSGSTNKTQVDFRSVLKNKVENKPEWIK